MAGGPRRPDSQGPADPGRDQGEFGWLYGKKPGDQQRTRSGSQYNDRAGGRPGRPPPEATRVMPVQPRPGQQPPQRPPQPPPPGPTRPGRGPTRRFGGRRPRRPRSYVRIALLLVLLWVVYTVAVPFFTWTTADAVAFEPEDERPPEQDGTTYLLVGSDSRQGLTPAERRRFSTGNPQSELTDTIMLLHTGSGPNVLLSVPRDSVVEMPGYGQSKINSAFARGGPELLVRTLENETGIRIDEYVQIGLGGVAGVVDAVGGIEVCPRERIRDRLAGLRINKGCQEVDGETALAYSRSRKQSALGDLDRVRRQREVVSAVGDAVLSPWTVLNPVRWWRINRAVPEFFRFGESTSAFDAAQWALAMTRVDGTTGLTCTVPVTDSSATTWDPERAEPLFQAIIDDETGRITRRQCTPSGVPR